jgi:hypothetical protein
MVLDLLSNSRRLFGQHNTAIMHFLLELAITECLSRVVFGKGFLDFENRLGRLYDHLSVISVCIGRLFEDVMKTGDSKALVDVLHLFRPVRSNVF